MAELQNVALVTKTLVHSGAAAVDGRMTLDLPSFFDLCALMESCVILDRAQAIESADVLPVFALSERLRSAGLLEEFRPALSQADLHRITLRLPELLSGQIPNDFWDRSDRSADQQAPEDQRPAGLVDEAGALVAIDYAESNLELHDQLIQMVHFPSLHARGAQTLARVHRSNGYLVVAAAHGLDYFPDFDRAPFVKALLDRTYRSLPVQLYRRVAEALEEPLGKAELVAEWTLRMDLPVPPVSALVLHRARSLDEIPDRLLEVRAEFASYRRHFADFKAELHEADTLRRRVKLQRRYEQLLETASGPAHERVSALEMLNLAEKAVQVAVSPQLPTSYSALLLAQPLEWIRRWWVRRPLAVLFRLDSKLPRLSEYRSLIEKLWGERVSDEVLAQYGAHARQLRRLMSGT